MSFLVSRKETDGLVFDILSELKEGDGKNFPQDSQLLTESMDIILIAFHIQVNQIQRAIGLLKIENLNL